jgi:DNA-binding NarL/FixJ family response regulator
MTSDITIVLADDHPVVRSGLRQAIDRDPALKVLAEADDGDAAVQVISQLRPTIAVLDIDMPKLDGFAVARVLQRQAPEVKLVFLTIHGKEDLFHAAMDLGARGYLLKQSALPDIVRGLRAVAAGEHFVTSSLTSYLIDRRARSSALASAHPALGALTENERRIVRLIADGRSSKEIASELFLHYRTVENYRTAICQKLGISGANALLKFALQHRSDL